MSQTNSDLSAINQITSQFFSAFTNIDKRPEVGNLREMLIPEALIVNNTSKIETYNLEAFIIPREQILTDGSLLNFSEEETSAETHIHDRIAHRISQYKKSGIRDGQPFETSGVKSIQFVRVANTWKIASVIWCDS